MNSSAAAHAPGHRTLYLEGGTTALSDDFLMARAKKGAAKGRYQGKDLKLLRKMQTMLSVVMTRSYSDQAIRVMDLLERGRGGGMLNVPPPSHAAPVHFPQPLAIEHLLFICYSTVPLVICPLILPDPSYT